jgi:hypothetical protein
VTPLTVTEARAILVADQALTIVNSPGRLKPISRLNSQEQAAWSCLVESARKRIAMWKEIS